MSKDDQSSEDGEQTSSLHLSDLNGALLVWETSDGDKRAVEFEDKRSPEGKDTEQ